MIPSVPASVFLVAGVFLAIGLLRALYARMAGSSRNRRRTEGRDGQRTEGRDGGRDGRRAGGTDVLSEIRALNDWPDHQDWSEDRPVPADPDAVACPNCLARNDPDYAFCRECAAELPD